MSISRLISVTCAVTDVFSPLLDFTVLHLSPPLLPLPPSSREPILFRVDPVPVLDYALLHIVPPKSIPAFQQKSRNSRILEIFRSGGDGKLMSFVSTSGRH